jgi:hypothetical protein
MRPAYAPLVSVDQSSEGWQVSGSVLAKYLLVVFRIATMKKRSKLLNLFAAELAKAAA